MTYNPSTDFLGLLRLTGGAVRSERMPGLDWLVAALNRIGMFSLSVGQTAPTTNQATTFWLKPAQPSWSAEGTLYIWNPVSGQYEIATPTLWQAFLAPAGSVFQSLTDPANIINAGVSLAAVQRVAPANTTVQLPVLAQQYLTQKDILLCDYSTGVANHSILVTTPDGSTIMGRAQLQLLSTADNSAVVRLRPSPDLNSWVVLA